MEVDEGDVGKVPRHFTRVDTPPPVVDKGGDSDALQGKRKRREERREIKEEEGNTVTDL